MRIVVLGGAGDMGSQVVEDLCAQPQTKEVLIADYNKEKASLLAQRFGEKAKSAFVDANRAEALTALVQGYNAAVSAIGPFYQYEKLVASAVQKAGVPYVSLCDDYDAAEAVRGLTKEAKERGVTLISGCGWTPGLSNILVKAGIEDDPEIEEAHIAWSGDAADSEGLAVIQHTIHIFTGKVKTFHRGKLGWIQAGTGKELVDFPSPIGTVPVFHVGHPEPVTLPQTFPQLKTVFLKGGLTPPWLNTLARLVGRSPLTTTAKRKQLLAQLFKRVEGGLKIGGKEMSGLVVLLKSREQQIRYRVADHMRRLTGIPASIAALLCADGSINKAGVHFPEGCIPSNIFLEELQKRQIYIEKEITRR